MYVGPAWPITLAVAVHAKIHASFQPDVEGVASPWAEYSDGFARGRRGALTTSCVMMHVAVGIMLVPLEYMYFGLLCSAARMTRIYAASVHFLEAAVPDRCAVGPACK